MAAAQEDTLSRALGLAVGWQWAAAGMGGAQVSMEYDLDGQLVAIEDVDRLNLVRNLDGQLTGVSHLASNDDNMIYGYDAGHRLTQADNALWSGPMAYGYDAVANRTSKAHGTDGWQYAYGASSNRLVSITPNVSGCLGLRSPAFSMPWAMPSMMAWAGSSPMMPRAG